jgi:hypothetical protein
MMNDEAEAEEETSSFILPKKKAQPVKTARILYKGAPEQPMRAMEEQCAEETTNPPNPRNKKIAKNDPAPRLIQESLEGERV